MSLVPATWNWILRWWKHKQWRWMEIDRFWCEIGISQFVLDLSQLHFSWLWRTGVVVFGTRLYWIWTGSIPVEIHNLRWWFERWNRRKRQQQPSYINIIQRGLKCRWNYYEENKVYCKTLCKVSLNCQGRANSDRRLNKEYNIFVWILSVFNR